MRACRRVFVAASLALCAAASSADEGQLSDINYRLGSGMRVPGLGLTVGGYLTGAYQKLRGLPGRAALEDLSLSIWWEGSGRWKAFAEFDGQNSLSSRAARADDEHRYLALERAYLDYAATELTTVRVGKFLTPIGRWNQMHATPLVWTTSRPLVTTVAFPTNVTGVMVSGTLPVGDRAVDYALYGSTGDEVRPNPALDTFHEAIGVRMLTALASGAQLGLSYVSFEQASAEDVRKQLFGADFFWTHRRFEVSAEVVYRVLHESGSRNEGGGFVQLVAPLSDRLSAIGRIEVYRPAGLAAPAHLHVTGVSYRVHPAVVLKAEWVGGGHNDIGAPNGLLSSVSLLF